MNKVIIILFVIVALIFVVVFRIEIKKNELEAEKVELTKEYEDLEYEHQEMQNKLDKELDEETIREVAKDELGLVEPNSEYYYGD